MTRLMASVAFAGDFGDPEYTHDAQRDCTLDVDAAAAELRQAGYEVFRLPDKYGGHLAHPLDDFLEAHIEGVDCTVIDAIRNEVETIVAKYGGYCYEWGPNEPNHVPFVDLLNTKTDPDPEGLGPRYIPHKQAQW
jgi:hypothetical protein